MKILYEDNDILIIEKGFGVSSEYLKDENPLSDKYSYLAPVYRLDTVCKGVMMYAKNRESASFYSNELQQGKIDKTYIAIVEGKPLEDKGIYEDFLFKDSKKNKSYVVKRERKGVKKAKLSYEVITSVEDNGKTLSLVKVKLFTGRTHQIRVQFSSRKMPLLGDGKYGSFTNKCSCALWCMDVSFDDKGSSEIKKVTSLPDTSLYPWNLFEKYLKY